MIHIEVRHYFGNTLGRQPEDRRGDSGKLMLRIGKQKNRRLCDRGRDRENIRLSCLPICFDLSDQSLLTTNGFSCSINLWLSRRPDVLYLLCSCVLVVCDEDLVFFHLPM